MEVRQLCQEKKAGVTHNSGIQEAKAGSPRVQGQPGLHKTMERWCREEEEGRNRDFKKRFQQKDSTEQMNWALQT